MKASGLPIPLVNDRRAPGNVIQDQHADVGEVAVALDIVVSDLTRRGMGRHVADGSITSAASLARNAVLGTFADCVVRHFALLPVRNLAFDNLECPIELRQQYGTHKKRARRSALFLRARARDQVTLAIG